MASSPEGPPLDPRKVPVRRGRLTIPAGLRKILGIPEETELAAEAVENSVVLYPAQQPPAFLQARNPLASEIADVQERIEQVIARLHEFPVDPAPSESFASVELSERLGLAVDSLRHFREAERDLVRLETLVLLQQVNLEHLPLDELVVTLLRHVPATVGADAAAISLLDPRSPRFRMIAPDGSIVTHRGIHFDPVVERWSILGRFPVVVHDIHSDRRVQVEPACIELAPYHSYAAFPLAVENRVLGHLHLFMQRHMVLGERELAFLQTLAANISRKLLKRVLPDPLAGAGLQPRISLPQPPCPGEYVTCWRCGTQTSLGKSHRPPGAHHSERYCGSCWHALYPAGYPVA